MKAKLIIIAIGLSMLTFVQRMDKVSLKKAKTRLLIPKPEKIHIQRATTYNATVSQCDNDPFTTADGSIIDLNKLKSQSLKWCALSRDLLSRWGGLFNYGDTIDVYSISSPQINGKWCVRDCMNKRYTKSVDFLFDASNNVPKLGVCTDLIIKI